MLLCMQGKVSLGFCFNMTLYILIDIIYAYASTALLGIKWNKIDVEISTPTSTRSTPCPVPSFTLGYTEVKSPTISNSIASPTANQSRGLLSTISGFLTRSPAAQSTSIPKDIPESGSPTPAANPRKGNEDKMAATRKAVSRSAEPAEEDVEAELVADEGDDDEEDVPEEEYEVDKVIDHRKEKGPLVRLQLAFPSKSDSS